MRGWKESNLLNACRLFPRASPEGGASGTARDSCEPAWKAGVLHRTSSPEKKAAEGGIEPLACRLFPKAPSEEGASGAAREHLRVHRDRVVTAPAVVFGQVPVRSLAFPGAGLSGFRSGVLFRSAFLPSRAELFEVVEKWGVEPLACRLLPDASPEREASGTAREGFHLRYQKPAL